MKVLDGYCDYSWTKELEVLISKMANLSKYKSILFDSMLMKDHETKLFNKALKDYSLFEAGMLYIFSKKIYAERLISVFNDLTYKERCNFYAYYSSCHDMAVRYGFLTEYAQILRNLDVYSWWNRRVGQVCILFLAYISSESFLIPFSLFMFFILSDIFFKVSDPSSPQMDLIIHKLYSDRINQDLDWAKNELAGNGWLDTKGKIKMTDVV